MPQLACFLVRAGSHRALVLDEGRLVGIVSAFDIVEELARLAEPAETEALPLEAEDIEC